MSSFIAIWPTLPFLLFRILCNNSYAIAVFSVIKQFGTKALWASNIMVDRIVFNLFAKTLEGILDTALPKLMGQ